MSMVDEFKEFALKGNVVDLAIGVVIGAAFGAVVNSLVTDVIGPVLGLLTGGVDFSHLGVVLRPGVGDPAKGGTPANVLAYGKFIQSLFSFVLVAIVLFMIIKGMNKMKRKPPPAAAPSAPVPLTREEVLLAEIRDLLRSRA